MPSNLTVATAIALLQWLCALTSMEFIAWAYPEVQVPVWLNPDVILFGNLQILVVLWAYQTITKYIKF